MSKRGDFTADLRLLWLAALALPLGAICAVVAVVLQRLIWFFTNLFYYQHFGIPSEWLSPAGNTLGWLAIFVPVVGGLIVGLMARYGSDRIRGHGIPEAIEAILIGQSRMQPRVAVLKPLSSAISIGSGGPFGAEGPIIMTGGACGSMIAQVFRMTSAERKTLLVAGAAAGMSATFGTPLAAVLLAVEILLFEWKPRSFVPVAIASAMATVLRGHFIASLGLTPLYSVASHVTNFDWPILCAAVLVGLSAGLLAMLLTAAVYGAEDLFHRLPIHWMWWPAIGGVIVGVGGYFQPRALGVSTDVIADLLAGKEILLGAALALIVAKSLMWSLSLGSGTSGGVLAPLLMMGGLLGTLESHFLPVGDARLWALVGMAAVMGGAMRAPLTGIVFAMELTYDIRALLPVMVAGTVSHALTVLLMKRSILTEKVARRGYHVSQEYSIDPLESLTVGDVMARDVVCVPANLPIRDLVRDYFLVQGKAKHQGYPVVDERGKLLGVITKSSLIEEWVAGLLTGSAPTELTFGPIITYDLIGGAPVTAYAWESCRAAAERMSQSGAGRVPVVADDDPLKVIGIISRTDLLKPHARHADEEALRERFLGPNLPGHRTEHAKPPH